MAKYRLTEQHFIDDRLLEIGTIIGEGTDIPFLDKDGKPCTPTPYMEGLDAASIKAVAGMQALDIDAALAQPGIAEEPVNAKSK